MRLLFIGISSEKLNVKMMFGMGSHLTGIVDGIVAVIDDSPPGDRKRKAKGKLLRDGRQGKGRQRED